MELEVDGRSYKINAHVLRAKREVGKKRNGNIGRRGRQRRRKLCSMRKYLNVTKDLEIKGIGAEIPREWI